MPVDPQTTADGLPILKKSSPTATTDDGLPILKKEGGAGSPHDFTHGYKPTPQDVQQKQHLNDLESGFDKLPNGLKPSQNTPPPKGNGSWGNFGDFAPAEIFAGLEKDMGNLFGFAKDKLAHLPGLAGVGAKQTMGAGEDFWKTAQKKDEAISAANPLPNTTGGHLATGVTKFVPDVLELALTPELDLAKLPKLATYAAKLGKVGTKAAEMAVGKFPIQQATKNMLQSYSDAKDNGTDPDIAALKGFGEGYKNGYIFEGLGKAGGKLTELGKGALEKVGLIAGNKFVAGAEKKLLNSAAQGIAFSAAPVLQNAVEGKSTSMDEIKDNALFGAVLGAVHGGDGEHTDADKAAAQIIMRKPLIDLHNFVNADAEDIKNIHNSDATAPDLQAQSAAHAEQGFKADNTEEKNKEVLQSALTGKASSIKSVTNAIMKDKQGVIDEVNQMDLPDEAKKAAIDKITAVHKELDPIEQQKTAIGKQITALDEQIGEKSDDPVANAENEVKQEQRKELNNKLKQLIQQQNESNEKGVPENGQEEGQANPAEKGGGQSEEKEKRDVANSGEAKPEPETTESKGGEENAIQEQGAGEVRVRDETAVGAKVGEGDTQAEKPAEQSQKEEKPRYKIKGDQITKLPVAEHVELNTILQNEDGITISHLKDVNNTQRDESGNSDAETPANAQTVQQPQNDGTGDAGKDRPSQADEGSKGTKSKTTFKKPDSDGEVKKTILTKRAYEGEVQDDVKKHLEEKGLTRKSFSQEERSKQATDFIDKFGDDAAYRAVEAGDIDGALAASTLAQLQIRNSEAIGDLPEGSPEREELAKKHADLIALMEKRGYFSGEFIGQLAHEYQNKELNFASIKRQIEKLTKKPLTKEQEAKVKEVTAENEKLKSKLQEAESKLIEETDKAFKAGEESVKGEKKADKAKRVATSLRALKITSVNDATLGIPIAFYNGAIETTATIIENGGKVADAIDAGLEHLRESDWYKGLSASKQRKTEGDYKKHVYENAPSSELSDLQHRFVDKTDNKFTHSEAKDIWGYMKETYLNNGVSYKDALSKTTTDLGLSWRQVSEAIVTPKLKRASDEMWKKQSELTRNRSAIKTWIGEQSSSAAVRGLKKISGLFRGVAVFAHGHIFLGTHAGMTFFNPSTWNKTIPAFFRGFKLAYGNEADYAKAMEELKNSPNYLVAQRAGLKNDPERINTEEYQKSQQYLGKLGKVGERGFNTIKVLRQNLFDYEFNKLTPDERDDPEVAKSIAQLMNLATGATNLKLPSWVNEATFAGGMEASRWGKLLRSPAKATRVALNALLVPEKASTADRVFAKVWARRVGEQLATYLAARAANAAINNMLMPPNKKEKIFDPTDAQWWKFKAWDTTIDPTSGMRSAAEFIHTIGSVLVEDKKALHGDSRLAVEGKKGIQYARGKLAPLYGTVADFAGNRDFNGNVMPKFPISALNRDDKTSKFQHQLGWAEYGSSKLPLPVAEAFSVFYQSALEHGADKKTLHNAIKGIVAGAISGTTGFRVGENHSKNSMKKVQLLKK